MIFKRASWKEALSIRSKRMEIVDPEKIKSIIQHLDEVFRADCAIVFERVTPEGIARVILEGPS